MIMDWLVNNKEWLFSGVGIAIIPLILYLLGNKKDYKKNRQSKPKLKFIDNTELLHLAVHQILLEVN